MVPFGSELDSELERGGMDSDNEYEAFQVTEEDILNEFGTRRRKKSKKSRKEDAVYGMWADPDSDDDDYK